MGIYEMAVMDATGDTKVTWDINKPDEVEAARKMFNSLKKKGYLAYTKKKKELINEFDPKLGKIIMIPPVVGG